jgi:60 kDa SS-A/Ro ribonucleoprotein
MVDVLRGISTRQTPQSQPAGGATVKNAAGGYVFGVSDLARVKRFLVLGSEGGTYYTKPADLTRENAEAVIRLAGSDPRTLVDTIVEISTAGRAPRQNPAIFALAIAASIPETPELRAYALAAIPQVCRTATHLYLFEGYTKQFRGRGPALNRHLRNWYLDKPVDRLAYQALKYRQRDGWSHRDMLRLLKPVPNSPERDSLFAWIAGKADEKREYLPPLVTAFEQVQLADVLQAISLIRNYDLSWEMLPDRLLNSELVWEALIEKGLPQTALLRQLPRLTKLGLATGSTGRTLAKQLADPEQLKRGRVHPINVLVAQRTYASGQSARGDGTWTPSRLITDALDAAFYAAYGAVEASGKRILLACDVSGSMSSAASGLPISCREAVAALSLVSLNVETDCEVIGFSDGGRSNRYGGWGREGAAMRLDISPRRRLDDVCSYMSSLNFGRTDCALPMIWATQNKVDVDAIWTLTDNETWYGQVHPHQALKAYREHVGHDVRYGVVAMTATGQSIADPNDPQSIDIAGFDSNVPQVISSFSAGLI